MQMSFIEEMVPLDEERNIYSYMTCDGAKLKDELNPFESYSWAFLAYASMYDATGDEKYINPIKKIEQNLFYEYTVLKSGGKEIGHEIMTNLYVLDKGFRMLEGKGILDKEAEFKEIIFADSAKEFIKTELGQLPDEVFFVPDVAKVSLSLTSVLPFLQQGNEKEEISILARDHMLRSKAVTDFEGKVRMCWTKLAMYNYFIKTGQSIKEISDYFSKPVTETVFVEATRNNPQLLQPCLEVLSELYESEEDGIYFKNYNELYGMMVEKSKSSLTCSQGYNFALRSHKFEEENQDEMGLEDNSYSIYLLTRSEIKNQDLSIK